MCISYAFVWVCLYGRKNTKSLRELQHVKPGPCLLRLHSSSGLSCAVRLSSPGGATMCWAPVIPSLTHMPEGKTTGKQRTYLVHFQVLRCQGYSRCVCESSFYEHLLNEICIPISKSFNSCSAHEQKHLL